MQYNKAARWELLNWKQDNTYYARKYNVSWQAVQVNRRKYAPETITRPHNNWKEQVQSLLSGKRKQIIVDTFAKQAAVRNAAYNMGEKIASKTLNNGKFKMYINK